MPGYAEIKFRLPFVTELEGALYVATCHLLDVASQGSSVDEARDNLVEALHLFLESCHDMGTLDAVLKDSGFTSVACDSDMDDDGADYLEVPLSLLARDAGHGALTQR